MACKVVYDGVVYDQEVFEKRMQNGLVPEINLLNDYVNNGELALIKRSPDLFREYLERPEGFQTYSKKKLKDKFYMQLSPAGKALFTLMEDRIPEELRVDFYDKQGKSGLKRILGEFKVSTDNKPIVSIFKHDANQSEEQTLLHELFHASLDAYIDSYQRWKDGQDDALNPIQIEALQNIERLYDIYMAKKPKDALDFDMMMKGAPKIKKIKEFINEALTDKSFISTLNEIPFNENVHPNPAMQWMKTLFELFTKLFGIDNNTMASAMLGNVMFLMNTTRPKLAFSEFLAKEEADYRTADDFSQQREVREYFENLFKRDDLKVDKDNDGNELNTYNNGIYQRVTNIINKKFRGYKDDYDGIKNDADRIWKNRDKKAALKLPNYDYKIDYDTYIEEETKLMRANTARGQIIHLEFQLLTGSNLDTEAIKATINQLKVDNGIEESFTWVADVYSDLRGQLQFTDNTDNLSEVPIKNDLLGIAGKIDHLIIYEDGTIGINDWKSGSSFEKTMTNLKMLFGDQTLDIPKNHHSAAKLQVMMYAVLLKAENPDLRFKTLSVHWVNRTSHSAKWRSNSRVNVPAYLGAIEQYIKKEKPAEVYNELKNKGVFNPNAYVGYSNKFSNYIADVGGVENAEVNLDKEILQLVNRDPRRLITGFNGATKMELGELAIRRLQIEAGGDHFTSIDTDSNASDISIFKRWFASYEDIDNPYINQFKKILDKRLYKARRQQRRFETEFQKRLTPVYEDWLRKSGQKFRRDLFKNRLTKVDPTNEDGTGLYDFAWVNRDDHGFKWQDVIHPERDKALFDKLTVNQQRLLSYFHEVIHQYMNEEDKNNLLNRVVGTKPTSVDGLTEGESITNRDILERKYRRTSGQAFKYYKGLTPRFLMSQRELSRKFGIFSKENLKTLYDRYLTFRVENTWDEWFNEEDIIPIKGMPNDHNLQSDMYTRNLEIIFDKFTRNMVIKDNLDDVYALGQGLRTYLEMKYDGRGANLFKNTIAFLEDKLLLDILNQVKTENFATKAINLPAYRVGDNDDDKMRGIRSLSVHKVLSLLKSTASASIMWLQPVNGTRNGIFVGLVNSKEAIRNSIVEKGLKGVDRNEVDFTAKDLAFAYSQVMQMYKDSIFGNVRANKAYIMAKKLDYLPDNFDWASNNNELLTSSNNLIEQSTMYMFHTIPEEAHAIMTMVAQLNHMKVTVKGKEISLWNAYSQPKDVGNGVYDVEWEGGIRGYVQTGDKEEELRELTGLEARKLKRVYQRMHGNYRREERAALEAYILGQIFIQFRKYLGAVIFGALGSKRYDQTLGYYKPKKDKDGKVIMKNGKPVMEWVGRLIEGRWRVLGKFILNYLRLAGDNQGTYDWANLSADQRAQLIDFSITMTYFLTILAAMGMIFDDDDEKDSVRQWLLVIAQNTTQHWNPVDQYRAIRQPPATFEKPYETFNGLLDLSMSLFLLSVGDSEGAFTKQGNLKGWAYTQKGIPGLSALYNARRFIDNTDVFGKDNGGLTYDFIRTR